MPDVTIPGPHGPVPAYLATPRAAGPWPGVVVLHDALGGATTCVTRPTGSQARDISPWRPTCSTERSHEVPARPREGSAGPDWARIR